VIDAVDPETKQIAEVRQVKESIPMDSSAPGSRWWEVTSLRLASIAHSDALPVFDEVFQRTVRAAQEFPSEHETPMT
jgi:hypothetical protein